MKNWIKRLSAALVICLGATFLPALPAFAINEVGCYEDGYLRIRWIERWFGGLISGVRCWANAGGVELNIPGEVLSLYSGNNTGYIIHYPHKDSDMSAITYFDEKFKTYTIGGQASYLRIY